MNLKDKVNLTVSLEGVRSYFYREGDVKAAVLEFEKEINNLETDNIKHIHMNNVRTLIKEIFGDFTQK